MGHRQREVIYSYLKLVDAYYPIVPVRLKYRLRAIETSGLLDSGATISVFDMALAEELGIKLKNKHRVPLEGVGGSIYGYIKKIRIEVAGSTITAPVVFVQQVGAPYHLLGRQGIFKHFEVSFLEKDRLVRFDPL